MKTLNFMRRMMSIARPTMCLLAAVTLSVSCGGDDDPEPMKPTLPAMGGSVVRTIVHNGAQTTSFDWTFTYAGERLTQAVGAKQDGSYTYTSSLYYGPNSVSISNSSGEITTATLNTQGYIESLTANEDSYRFYYADGRLVRWECTIYQTNFGQANKFFRSANISYDGGNFSRIVYTSADNVPVTLTFVPDDKVNFNGILPVGVSEELGLAGIEHLYYAGLLGRPTANLVRSVTAECPGFPSREFTLNYEYNQRGNNVTICNYHTQDGGVASVNYGY